MTARIRAAHPSDIDGLLDLIRQHAAYEKTTASITKPALASILAAACPPMRIIVAEYGEGLVGYAAVTFDYALWSGEHFAHLDCLFVCEKARGKTIGKQLFDHVGRLANDAAIKRMEWQTPAWNEDAIRFYIREGAFGRAKMRFSILLS